ncbi:MAG TPA: DUF2059 domain-containing protein [Caulobacteraceae bacterium]|nr:DUF2059 domain-containing protein [Caulobacteraceae bacterium]
MKLIALAGALALSLTASAALAAPTPHQLDLARRYIDDTHMADVIRSSVQGMRPVMMAQLGVKLTDAEGAQFDAAFDASYKRFLDQYFARVTPVLAETFSEEELTQLVAFYESPVGRSMIAKTPVLQAKLLPVIADLMPGFQADISQELCARFDCNAGQTAKPHIPKR